MGREWLYWVRGGGGGGGGGGGNRRSSSSSSTKREKMSGEMKEAGCMCAAFHLFNLQHFQFPSTHRNDTNTHPNINIHSFLQEEATSTTGVEAPRNSLELDESKAAMAAAASTPTAIKKQQENLNFPVGIKIKTSHGHGRNSSSKSKASLADICSENSSSCNSPSVVARLMGLDLLPQTQCNSPSIPKSRKDTSLLLRKSFSDDPFAAAAAAARSLPETPRTSSSSRKSDVERHRLSLQIDKENNNISKEELALSGDKRVGRRGRFDGGRSVGLDITNTINRNTSSHQSKADQSLILLKPNKKNSKVVVEYSKQSNAASRSRNMENNYKIKPTAAKVTNSSRISSPSDINHQSKEFSDSKKLPARAAVRREDGFVRSRERNKLHSAQNKSKTTTTLSCVNGRPSPPHTKLPQKKSQVSDALSLKSSTQLSTKESQPYNQHNAAVSQCSTDGGATALHGGASPDHRNYIHIILKHTGIIDQVNPLVKWHTPSQPIDPRIFHHLELKAAVDGCDTVLSRRCERKLIFQLIDELLAEIVTHRFRLKQWISAVDNGGGCSRLVDEIFKKMDSFPAAKCVVLEDIDSLIDRDLRKSQSNGFWGEEEDDVVREIEGEIVEWLVREAVAVMGGDAGEE